MKSRLADMNPKQFLWSALGFCILLFPMEANAQKVTERSQKKRPDWVGITQQDYLIVSATDTDLENAKQKCLASVKVQMLESVAQNIEYSTETLVEQFTHNQDVESNISFRQQGKTSVVNLPYISGISLAKAEESYWEKVVEDGKSYYVFSLLYPYGSSDYHALKSEFEKLDAEMEGIVKKHEAQLSDIGSHIGSVEDIQQGKEKLQLAKDYFFDAKRCGWTENVINQYQKLFANLTVESKRIGKCKYQCRIALEGKLLKSSMIPSMKAECATRMKCSTDGESYIVTFSDEDCIEDDSNFILMTFKWKERTLKYKLYF